MSQMMFDAITTMAGSIADKQLTALMVTGAKRSPVLPNVPTAAEAGLSGYEATIWLGLMADRLGLREATTGRLRTFPNGMTAMAALARHEGGRAIGSTQVTEIVATSGVRLVASLPAPFDLATVYTAGVGARSTRPGLARLMIEVLSAPERAADSTAVGFKG